MKKILLILLIFISAFSYSQNTISITNEKIVIDSTITLNAQHVYINTTFGGIDIPQTHGALTDMTPTLAEVEAIIGLASDYNAGYKITIKDDDGAGNLYMIESDGTDWYYIQMNKAVNP